MLGCIVHYKLSADDATAINKRRNDFTEYVNDYQKETGHIGHFGNRAEEGQKYPALVVRNWGNELVNLQVFLDGNDTLWKTSVKEGEDSNTWAWPVRS